MTKSSQTKLTRKRPLTTHGQDSRHQKGPKSREGPFRVEPVLVDLTCDEVLIHGEENNDFDCYFPANLKLLCDAEHLRLPHVLSSPLPETFKNLGTDYTPYNLQYFLIRESHSPGLRCFRSRSPQLSRRAQLIKEILEIKKLFNLLDTTASLAIRIMDFFMDSFSIGESHLFLLAMVSLRLAAKFEDKESQIPKINSIKKVMKEKLSHFYKSNFHQLEAKVLTFFKFQINFPTTVQFLEFFSKVLVDIKEDGIIQTSHLIETPSKDIVLQNLRYYMEQFVHIYLHTTELIPFLPSIMGCAILFASRIAVGLSPYWPERFIRYSGGIDVPQNENIVVFSNYLINTYNKNLTLTLNIQWRNELCQQIRLQE